MHKKPYVLLGPKFLQSRIRHQSIQRHQRKHFPPGCDNHLLHIFPAHAEAASTDAGNNLIFRIIRTPACKAQLTEVLNTGYLISGRTVIFGDLCFDDDLGIEFAGDDEIRSLVKAFNLSARLVLRKLIPALVRTSSNG